VNPSLLIPIYNHKDTILPVLRALAELDLPCLVVNDGSDAATSATLEQARRQWSWVPVETLAQNRGRGAALRHGYHMAQARGFSHVVQLDADGQHDTADVPVLLAAAEKDPDALILGAPVFDDSAPRNRLVGRQLSRFWVHVETMSRQIADPLCGFRCLPLAPTVKLLSRTPLGDRMEFDPEIAVRLVWEGLAVVNVPTRVRYFAGGVSHFRLLHDNVRISWAHARLVFGMLARLHRLLGRRRRGGS
jgi:glycosyltransferase involved in cell wall biosynthesis